MLSLLDEVGGEFNRSSFKVCVATLSCCLESWEIQMQVLDLSTFSTNSTASGSNAEVGSIVYVSSKQSICSVIYHQVVKCLDLKQ